MESDGTNADNLLALAKKCGLELAAIVSKLMCFDVDEVSTFQGPFTRNTIQMIVNLAPSFVGQYNKGHKLNLTIKILSMLSIVIRFKICLW